jgi:RES domain-containing protein
MPTHHSFDDLLRRIKACKVIGQSWNGYLFRFADPGYAKKHTLTSGIGSYKNGGRWNGPGSFRAVYASLTANTAIIETESWARYFNVATHATYPKVMVSLNVSLQNVFDLTSGSHQSHLGVPLGKMLKCDWRSENEKGREALTQTIGRAIFVAGYEGILVPSSPDPNGVNLVCFSKSLGATSYIKCVNEEKL